MEIQLWREKLDPYAQAVTELTTKFENLKREYKRKNLYCPIESVKGRVKEVASILEKTRRKGMTIDRIFEDMEDIAGIRIICQFIEDIPVMADLLRRRRDLTILEERDYLINSKESGYRSYHLIVHYTVETLEGPKTVLVEIQLRTMAMDFWATSEHFLQYKYKGDLPEHITLQLARISEATEILDQEMMKVRNEIMDAENDSQIQINMVRDILIEIENLYRVRNEREAVKIQDEFYRIFAENDFNALKYFHDQLDLLSEDNHSQGIDMKNLEEL